MTTEHLTQAQIVDLASGEAVPGVRRDHAAECVACARQIAEAREGLRAAAAAGEQEPGDLFWEGLRRSIMARVRDDLALRRRRAHRIQAFVVAASVLLSILAWSRIGIRAPWSGPPSRVPSWVALPPSDQDAGWSVVEEVLPALEEEAWNAGVPALADLSPAESEALAQALRDELAGGRQS